MGDSGFEHKRGADSGALVPEAFREYFEHVVEEMVGATAGYGRATQYYLNGVLRYFSEFSAPFWTALGAFSTTEREKLMRHAPWDSLRDYLELFRFNLQVAQKGNTSSLRAMADYHLEQARRQLNAWTTSCLQEDGETIDQSAERLAAILKGLVTTYPEAIRTIETEYGFHFDDGGYRLAAETDRFFLYQVLPNDGTSSVDNSAKPIIIIPPYVLGANILAFLPGERKSYVHAYANQGIPTYVRVIKDIQNSPAVQTMSGEDDALDTRVFCQQVAAAHNRRVTLNGFCQGGFVALAGLLSGELDDLVDALITCVAPMDGSRSKALVEYLAHLPHRFRDLGYAVKPLENGNRVVDGKVMSWVYKLKSMENEAPLFAFYRDLTMFDRAGASPLEVSKTAAAINRWLIYDRNDLPEDITKMSFDSYTVPVDKEGNLPFTLFHRKLNFKRLQEKKIPVLLCYAANDDLVDREAALAPLDFIDAEVTVFPKGHGAIATSWSHPESACALHTRFGEKNYRGPVRFQLDLSRDSAAQVASHG
jgi:hypothetical protein